MTTAFFIALCLIWGSTWMAIKINLSAFPPFLSAGLRFFLAGIVLLLIAQMKNCKFNDGLQHYMPSLVFGILNGISYGLVYWGEQFISSGLTAILNASLPFFSIIFAFTFIGEEITFGKVSGLIAGFGGVLLLFYDSISDVNTGKLWGQLSIVIASAIYAFAGVYMKKRSDIAPLEAVTVQMFTSSAVLLAIAVPLEHNRAVIYTWPAVMAFFYLSIIGSALAFYLYNNLILRMEVSKLSYISMITPGIATILGVVWLAEKVHWQTMAGMALILTGTAVINLRIGKDMKQKQG